jgi:hypothetical protein
MADSEQDWIAKYRAAMETFSEEDQVSASASPHGWVSTLRSVLRSIVLWFNRQSSIVTRKVVLQRRGESPITVTGPQLAVDSSLTHRPSGDCVGRLRRSL